MEKREANCKSDWVEVKQSEQFASTAAREETGNIVWDLVNVSESNQTMSGPIPASSW